MNLNEQISQIGFKLVNIIKGDPNGYPNDVYIYHRIIQENRVYQEIRIDADANVLAFENIWGGLEKFKIWLGVRQATNIAHLEYKYYNKS